MVWVAEREERLRAEIFGFSHFLCLNFYLIKIFIITIYNFSGGLLVGVIITSGKKEYTGGFKNLG